MEGSMSDAADPGARTEGEPAWIRDPDIIVFAGERELPIGAVEQHDIGDVLGDLFGRKKEAVKQDWEQVLGQIRFLLDRVSAAVGDYDMDEITFQLGFSAEGQVVFVAKAGVQTTISATFRKHSGGE
jgi:hypothetical protein